MLINSFLTKIEKIYRDSINSLMPKDKNRHSVTKIKMSFQKKQSKRIQKKLMKMRNLIKY